MTMKFAVIGVNHGHIYGQVEGLLSAPGVSCAGVCAAEPHLLEEFSRRFPDIPVRSRQDILKDTSIDLIASAAINSDRAGLAIEVLSHGKHFFVDKPPVTDVNQIEPLRRAISSSGRLFFVYYSERLTNPFDSIARERYRQGDIGELVHLMGLGPHRLNKEIRPDWMWNPRQYGGVLNDLLSHQIDWFCWFTGQKIRNFSSRVGRFGAAPEKDFDDFGDVTLCSEKGITGYFRVDWFTPEKNPVWGDVRGLIVGTRGTIEIRRIANLSATDPADTGPCMILTNDKTAPIRIKPSTDAPAWPGTILDSIRSGQNQLNDPDMLFHVMETTLDIQSQAVRVLKN
jgi:predicted dehydrogenase